MNIPDPIFAAVIGPEDLLVIAFMVIAGIVSLIRYIANKAQAPPPARRPPRPAAPRDEKIKNEIEVFLQEVTGRKAPPRQREAREGRNVVVVEQPPRSKSSASAPPVATPQSSAKTITRGALQTQPEPAEAPSGHPGGQIAGRKSPGSQDLGKSVTTHLSQYMDASRIERQVQNDLKHSIDEAVQAHLGKFTAEASAQTAPTSAGQKAAISQAIVRLLRNPQGVRQAILIKEILERPSAKGRRKRR